MSELRVMPDDVQVPHEDCNVPPNGLKTPDHCHAVLKLTDSRSGTVGPADQRDLRFDRNGDSFVVSLKSQGESGEFLNRPEDVTWFFAHENNAQVLNAVRIFGHLLPSPGIAKPTAAERADRAQFPLVIGNYIVTGRVEFPGETRTLESTDLAEKLLDVFANSNEAMVQELIGKIAYFQADSKLSEEAMSRVRWMVGILRIVPNYKKFFDRLVSTELQQDSDPEIKSSVQDLQTFAAKVVVNLANTKQLKYDETTHDAYRAYLKVHLDRPRKQDFCQALDLAIKTLPYGAQVLGKSFVTECRTGLELSQLPPEQAARVGLRKQLNSPRGHRDIQENIQREARKANMEADWLAKRGRIEGVTEILLKQLRIELGKSGQRVTVDAAGLRNGLELWIKRTKATNHREPVLASLGLLRLVFGKNVDKTQLRLFVGGRYVEVPMDYSQETMEALLKSLERELGGSLRGTEVWLPVTEGIVTAGGGATLGLALGLKGLAKTPRNALGYTGAATLGLGAGALIAHFIVPPIAKKAMRPVRNKYLWDLVGGAIGASIGVTVWGLATGLPRGSSAGNGMMMPPDPDPGDRYPVDDYGP